MQGMGQMVMGGEVVDVGGAVFASWACRCDGMTLMLTSQHQQAGCIITIYRL